MDAPVSNEIEDRIAAKIESGRYGSREDVLQKAMDRLDAHEHEQSARRSALRDAIREGLESGPKILADDDYWDSVKARGRERVESTGKSSREPVR